MLSSAYNRCACNNCIHCTRRKRESMRALRRKRTPWALSVRHWIECYLGYPRASPIADAGAPALYKTRALG